VGVFCELSHRLGLTVRRRKGHFPGVATFPTSGGPLLDLRASLIPRWRANGTTISSGEVDT